MAKWFLGNMSKMTPQEVAALVDPYIGGESTSRPAITADEITDDSAVEFGVLQGSSAKALSLAELKKTGVQVVNVLQYGADPTGVADSLTSFNDAMDDAEGVGIVYIPPGYYTISGSVTYKAPMIGANGTGSGSYPAPAGDSVVGKRSGNTSPAVVATSKEFVRIENLFFHAFNTGIELNSCNRYLLRNVRCRLGTVGFDLDGFIGTIDNCFALTNTDCGLRLTNANGVNVRGGEYVPYADSASIGVEVVSGAIVNFDGVVIEGSDGVMLKLIEGSARLTSCYLETSDRFMEVGSLSTQFGRLQMQSCFLSGPGGSSPELDVIDCGVLDVDDSNEFDAGYISLSSVNKCLNLPQASIVEDGQSIHGQVKNLICNPNAINGARWWMSSSIGSSLAITSETSNTRGNPACMKITNDGTAAGQARLFFPNNAVSCSDARAKTVRVSCWLYWDATSDDGNIFSITPTVKVSAVENLGTAVTFSSTGQKGEWRYYHGSFLTVPDSGSLTDLGIRIYMDRDAAVSRYVLVSDLCVWVDAGASRSPVVGDFITDVRYGSLEFGNVTVPGSAAPTVGTWAVGDKVYNTAPAAGGKLGWVCTTAGSPGTWKAFGAIDP